MTGEGQVLLALSRCFTTKTDPTPALTYPATSCGPCLSCLHQQRPATHGHPLFSDHGPPSHVCPLEKDVSDLDCPHLRSSEQPQQAVLAAPTPSGSGGCEKGLALVPCCWKSSKVACTRLIPKTGVLRLSAV